MMKNVLLLLLLTCSLSIMAQETFEFDHGNLTRTYILYLPDSLPDDAPLILAMHGYTSAANVLMAYSGLNGQADIHKFAVCYPFGTLDILSTPHWNSGLNVSETDDVGFLSDLAIYLQAEYKLNPNHTFACGMSNGGFMSYTLACERPDVFKAIASVTGTMSGGTWNSCDPENPVPVLQISGLDDETVPVDGSMSSLGGWGGAPDMNGVNDFWKDLNECTTTETVAVSEWVEATYHRNGINGNEVWLYPIAGWGHVWPVEWALDMTGISGAEVIWDFFSLVVNGDVVGVEEAIETQEMIRISPNPATNQLVVELQNNRGVAFGNYQVYTIQGQLLVGGVSEGNTLKIDLSDLPTGSYILHTDYGTTRFEKID